MVQISDKQKDFLTAPLARINLLEGAVRSGKTWISLVMWALFVASMPRNVEFLMVGKTLTTLKRNCLVLLQDLEPSFSFSVSKKQASLYGRTIWLEGANDERSEGKIRGMTLGGAYVDELTLIPDEFYKMILGRMSEHGAKLFATTNPDAPTNYVYTDIILNDKINRKVTKFLITDNPYLDPEYVKALEKEYTGVFYERYFLGNWVKAEGLVYPMYDNTVKPEPRTYEEFCVSMDYGTYNPTAILLWGRVADVWYIVDEYYHSGRETNIQKTDQEYYDALCELCGDRPINRIYADPSAASFITLIRQRGRYHVNKANNDVMVGIQHTASCLAERRVLVNDCCKNTIREFGLYSWDDDEKKTVDAVIKENDHAMDAVRYFVQTKRIWKEAGRGTGSSIFG